MNQWICVWSLDQLGSITVWWGKERSTLANYILNWNQELLWMEKTVVIICHDNTSKMSFKETGWYVLRASRIGNPAIGSPVDRWSRGLLFVQLVMESIWMEKMVWIVFFMVSNHDGTDWKHSLPPSLQIDPLNFVDGVQHFKLRLANVEPRSRQPGR